MLKIFIYALVGCLGCNNIGITRRNYSTVYAPGEEC